METVPMKNFGWNDSEAPFYHGYLLPAVESFLPPPSRGVVLDIGCGNGYFVNRLIDKGYSAYGIDIAADGIALANRTNPGCFFLCDAAEGTLPEPLRGQPIRTVVSMEVIEHLYSPRAFVELARRVLAANGGGTLIVSTPYHGYLKNFFISIVGKWDYHWGALWEGGHIKFWSRHTLTRLLEESGFRNVQFRGVGRFPYLWRHMVCRAEIGPEAEPCDPTSEPKTSN